MMKFLLVLVVLGVAFWLWRSGRQKDQQVQQSKPPPSPPHTPGTPGLPQTMLRCAHCGVHMPDTDAIRGQRAVYCSAAHRSAAGDD